MKKPLKKSNESNSEAQIAKSKEVSYFFGLCEAASYRSGVGVSVATSKLMGVS